MLDCTRNRRKGPSDEKHDKRSHADVFAAHGVDQSGTRLCPLNLQIEHVHAYYFSHAMELGVTNQVRNVRRASNWYKNVRAIAAEDGTSSTNVGGVVVRHTNNLVLDSECADNSTEEIGEVFCGVLLVNLQKVQSHVPGCPIGIQPMHTGANDYRGGLLKKVVFSPDMINEYLKGKTKTCPKVTKFCPTQYSF